MTFHPSGDYILAGTRHDYVRWYDLESDNCYTAKEVGISAQSVTMAPQVNFTCWCALKLGSRGVLTFVT